MNRLTNNTHLLFLISIPILVLLNFIRQHEPLDISIHDTYYVIEQDHLLGFTSIILGLIGLGYWLIQRDNRKLNKWLTLIHCYITFGGLVLILFFSFLFIETNELSKSDDFVHNLTLQELIVVVSLVTFIGQVLFLINLMIGLKKGHKTSG